MKSNIANVVQISFFTVIIIGGTFFFKDEIREKLTGTDNQVIMGKGVDAVPVSKTPQVEVSTNQNPQPSETEKNSEDTAATVSDIRKPSNSLSVPAITIKGETVQERQNAISSSQAFLVDWKNKYNAECTGNEMTSECIIWKNAISKIETTCFLASLSGEEVNKCAKDVIDTAVQGALWSEVEESLSTTTRTTVDQHGIDLAKLPEGKTVKVFKSGPTEEVSWGNETTVTYTRSGKTITIAEVIVYEGNRGISKYTRTVSLE